MIEPRYFCDMTGEEIGIMNMKTMHVPMGPNVEDSLHYSIPIYNLLTFHKACGIGEILRELQKDKTFKNIFEETPKDISLAYYQDCTDEGDYYILMIEAKCKLKQEELFPKDNDLIDMLDNFFKNLHIQDSLGPKFQFTFNVSGISLTIKFEARILG